MKKGSGCIWLLVILVLGGLMLLAGVVSTASEQEREPVNMGTRPTSAPNTSTVTVATLRGPVERPTWVIASWCAAIFVVVFVAAQVKRSGQAAGHGEAGTDFATKAVIVVVLMILIGVVSMTLGGG